MVGSAAYGQRRMSLKFGTDGWRALIAEEYTFGNVRRVCAGIEKAMRDESGGSNALPVVVGFDTRFLSRRFAETAAETLVGAGRRVVLARQACPTPATSCQVVALGAAFGVVITASHNPAAFNGVKVKDSTGASAGTALTLACEKQIPTTPPESVCLAEGKRRDLVEEASFDPAHRARLTRMVDMDAIRKAGIRIVTDPMHGACGVLLARMLDGGATTVTTIHADQDPLFGGMHPEPLEQHLAELRDAVIRHGAGVGFATDGDGDRIGAFDEKGQFVSPLRIAPLLALNLIRKGRRGPLGKTFANTLLLDRIAARYGLPFTTFPVGFKHIAAEMQAGRMLLGGEESGGIGVEGFLPERDGTMVSLMLLQAMVDEARPLSEMVGEMTREFGELHYRRRDLAVTTEEGRRLIERLKSAPPRTIGGMSVTGIDDLDGLKLLFGGDGWLLFRASGTEPVLRVYSEAPTLARLDAVMSEAVSLVS